MPRGWELFHGRSFDNLYWHWAGSSSFGGDVPVNPTSGVIPWNNAGTFDDSNLLRRNTSTTDLRYLVDGTVNQLFRIYKTSDNGIATPTNYERIVITSENVNNVFSITTEAGGTGVQRPINIGQASGANAVPVGINASPGALVAGRALQIGFTQATPTNDVGLYFEGISGQTGDFLQANNVDFGGVVFRILSTGEIAVRAAIRDVNQNPIIGFLPVASADQYVTIANANAGTPAIGVAGPSSNIDLIVGAKASGRVLITNTGTMAVENGSPFLVRIWNQGQYVWSDNVSAENGSVDTRLIRDAAGVVRVGAASTIGTLLAAHQVNAITTSTSPAANDSRRLYTNEGAGGGGASATLPGAAANLSYTFYVQDADGWTITAAAGDTIRLAGSVSATGGNIVSVTIGSSVTLVAINATEWVAISIVGTWVVT